MKKQQIKLLRFQKIRIANLSVINSIKGGQSGNDANCETNTNTTTDFCPPETYDCPSHVFNTCPAPGSPAPGSPAPDVESRSC